MNALAMATDYCGYVSDREDIRLTLRKIAEAGFTHVHWCHEWDGDHMYSEEEIRDIRDALNEFSLGAKGVHATDGKTYYGEANMRRDRDWIAGQPCFFSSDEELRKRGEALVRNRLELAAAIDTREIVLHMPLPFWLFGEEGEEERYYAQAFKSLDAVRAYAEAEGIRICFENLPGVPNDMQMEQFRRIFDRYPSTYAAYCCDTGHSILSDPKDPYAFARQFTDRMYMMHLNDNHSVPEGTDLLDIRVVAKGDEHHVMGDGVVDFDTFAQIVAASPYEGPPVGEFVLHGETDEEFLKTCLQRMDRFVLRVEELRSSRRSRTS